MKNLTGWLIVTRSTLNRKFRRDLVQYFLSFINFAQLSRSSRKLQVYSVDGAKKLDCLPQFV